MSIAAASVSVSLAAEAQPSPAPKTSMTHIAIAEEMEGRAVVWMEKPSAAQYAGGAADASTPAVTAAGVAKDVFAQP